MVLSKIFKKQETFIRCYDNTLTQEECDRIIEIFENSSEHIAGKVMITDTTEEKHNIKKSIELPNTTFLNQGESDLIILGGLGKAITNYHSEFYQLLEHSVSQWRLYDTYNIQKYVDETDGFKTWHCEAGNIPTSQRIMAWMIYLNDAKSGTDFYCFDRVKAKRGRCVIWPASWTHVHRSQLPNRGIKYLATGWLNFC